MIDFNLESKSRFFQQEWNDTHVLIIIITNACTAKIVEPFDCFCSAKVWCFLKQPRKETLICFLTIIF